MSLVTVFWAMGFQVGAWAFSLPFVVDEVQLEISQLGIVLTAMAVSGIGASILTGRIAERLTVRVTLSLAAGLSGIGYLVMPALSSFPAFTLGAIATGIGLGAFDVAANAAGSLAEIRSGATLLSSLHGVFSFAAACAAGWSYFMVSNVSSYAPAFWSAGVVCFVGAIAALSIPGNVPDSLDEVVANPPLPTDKAELSNLSKMAAIFAFVVVCGAFTVDSTMEGFSAIFIAEIPGQGVVQSAVGLIALYLASAFGRTLATPAIKRIGDSRTVLIGLGIVVVGVIVLVWVDAPWASAVGMMGIGIGLAPVAPIGYSVIGRAQQGGGVERATARLTTAGYGTFALAPLIVSGIGNDSLEDAFRLLPFLVAVMLVVTVWFSYKERAHRRRQACEVTP